MKALRSGIFYFFVALHEFCHCSCCGTCWLAAGAIIWLKDQFDYITTVLCNSLFAFRHIYVTAGHAFRHKWCQPDVSFGFYCIAMKQNPARLFFSPQAQWLSLPHMQIWENLPRTYSARALVKEQMLTMYMHCYDPLQQPIPNRNRTQLKV